MENASGFDPTRDLSERDRAMLSRHTDELDQRARESRERRDDKDSEKREWTVDIPLVHRSSRTGRPEDVKRGDKADITGRGSRHMSHPIDSEKLPLKGR